MTASRHATLSLRRLARLALAWLLAVVVPLQGLSAVAAVTAGSLHTHVATAEATAVLIDLRRAFAAPVHARLEAQTEWQHAVGHVLPQRHRHAASDDSVVALDDPLDGKQLSKAELQSAAFVAIVPAPAVWIARTASATLRSPAAWSPTTAEARLSERPPRSA